MIIRLYRTSSGRCPVEDFISEIPKRDQADIFAVIEDIRGHGLNAPLVSMRQIRGKLWEIRISYTRIFYVVIHGNTMVLLHAYKKQGQKTPQHEIDIALRRMVEVIKLENR